MSITLKIKRYHAINKGVVKAINIIPDFNLKVVAAIPVLAIASYSPLSAQCTMSILNNSQITFNGGEGGGIAFDVNSAGGPGNDFSIFEHVPQNNIRLKILNPDFSVLRVASHTDNSASVLRVTGNTTAGDFVNNGNAVMFLNYGVTGNNGQFSNGTDGFVIFKSISTGATGFFRLQYTYNTPDIHRVTIASGGIGDMAGAITPGDCSSLVLPVELINFTAIEKEEQIYLKWTTLSETENAGFEVQRSEDGKNFKSLNFIEGNGTTLIRQEYFHSDEDVHEGSLYYYRLKQIDFNGAFDYSKVLVVKMKSGGTTLGEVYPNPNTTGIVNVDFDVVKEEEWDIKLFDASGKILSNEQRIIRKGLSMQSFSFGKIQSGIYFLKFENGVESFYKKVFINRK